MFGAEYKIDGTKVLITASGSGSQYGDWSCITVTDELKKALVEATELHIDDGVDSSWQGFSTIPSDIFQGATKLETLDLSGCNHLNSIGENAFCNSKLTKVIFPEKYNNLTIGNRAFTSDFAIVTDDGELDVVIDVDDTGGFNPENIRGKTFKWNEKHKMLISGELEEPSHLVTYKENGGDEPAPAEQTLTEGTKFNLASYDGKKEGFEFKGWDYKGTTYQVGYEMTMGEENIVLTAVWEEQEAVCTVSFLLNGGEGSFPQISCYPGDKITISSAEPAKDSCTFDGWDCDGVRYSAGQVVTVNSDMTFTAQWKAGGSSDPVVPDDHVVPAPIFPGDEQEPIEVITDDGKDGSKDDEKTVLIIGIVVAIIAILAVMSVSKKT